MKVRIVVLHTVSSLQLAELCCRSENNESNAAIINNYVIMYGMYLTKPYNYNNDFLLKTEIFKTFQSLIIKFPEISLESIMSLLPTIFNLLQKCCDDYSKIIMNINVLNESDRDETNSLNAFEELVDSIYSFIHCLISSKGGEQYLYSVLPELVYSIVLFMTITQKIENAWQEDEMNLFNDDCEDMVCNNIRSTMRTLLSVSI